MFCYNFSIFQSRSRVSSLNNLYQYADVAKLWLGKKLSFKKNKLTHTTEQII